jgi:hypothetical protein
MKFGENGKRCRAEIRIYEIEIYRVIWVIYNQAALNGCSKCILLRHASCSVGSGHNGVIVKESNSIHMARYMAKMAQLNPWQIRVLSRAQQQKHIRPCFIDLQFLFNGRSC